MGAEGGTPHAVLSAEGSKIRWLLLAIAWQGQSDLLLDLSALVLYAVAVPKLLSHPLAGLGLLPAQ